MPVFISDRLPLPNLRLYTAISVLILSGSFYYAVRVTSDPSWKSNSTNIGNENVENITSLHHNHRRSLGAHCMEILTFMVQEPICIWTLINMAYCNLILLGRSIQRVVFGELRVSESNHLKDKFWNFVFYKFIFVFGVVNVQYMDEVTLWCSWFSILGFLHLLSQLCKDRFEYLSFSPTTPGWSHARLVGLLSAILVLSGFLFIVCVAVGYFVGLNTFAFMAAECVLLMLRTLHVLLRYGMHLYESRQGSFERRSSISYYCELVFELTALSVDLLHHLHMLLWSNIFLSMASLVICMQLRYLFHEIQRRIRKHRNYLWVLNHMELNYPMASPEDLAENSDNCAICWDKMDSARKLPCAHLFHNSCLQSWLEQDTSCPTCRLALSIPMQNTLDPAHAATLRVDQPDAPAAQRRPNHFFHFDGSRYVSWLPSFSVEVTHMHALLRDVNLQHTSQLDAMARQVQQLFPHYPLPTIISDLQITRSVELTVDNILDGRLSIPARFQLDTLDDILHDTNVFHDTLPATDTTTGTSTSNFDSGHSSNFIMNRIRQWNVENETVGNYDNIIDCDIPAADSGEEPSPLGDRFSKSSAERERILHRRKENLLQNARKRYLDRQTTRSAE